MGSSSSRFLVWLQWLERKQQGPRAAGYWSGMSLFSWGPKALPCGLSTFTSVSFFTAWWPQGTCTFHMALASLGQYSRRIRQQPYTSFRSPIASLMPYFIGWGSQDLPSNKVRGHRLNTQWEEYQGPIVRKRWVIFLETFLGNLFCQRGHL